MTSPTSPTALLIAQIDAALPQTQCTRCGYPDCKTYAEAIALCGAPINQCPPGGAEGVARLAAITSQAAQPLNPAHGLEGPRALAVIDENWCIGCTLCLDACPTDAIFGSNKTMHTVIVPYCTGCALCIPVCPVDCISLENTTGAQTGWQAWSAPLAEQARLRYEKHSERRKQIKGYSTKTLRNSEKIPASDAPALTPTPESTSPSAVPSASTPLANAPSSASSTTPQATPDADNKRAVIAAALAKARAARQNAS